MNDIRNSQFIDWRQFPDIKHIQFCVFITIIFVFLKHNIPAIKGITIAYDIKKGFPIGISLKKRISIWKK